ncbi:flagella protein [Natronorubrum sp. JWXQ-INN-674]|uniref:Flagella protein n=1 Tax=Natronorubrum halalkaliphilum TaxID=2691917 RepID=A0A6B0VKT9_9EURY|nr:FlaD/FlaE family flagellar protein [Natronorubrum halalkaliphilum]MXV61803.1 flagella protein [Natronorubrum halalkaliphilum]
MILFSGLGDADDADDEPDDDADDLLGGADDGLMGEGMMDDAGDDGDSDEELTYRLDEVEKEIDSLGNKVETVRGENEQISESITTVERNVDKLVEMYEIVTQGINPFVGDQELGNAFEHAADQSNVFGGGDDPEDEIDEDIANAEAEDFLADDLEDDDPEDAFDDEPGADADETFDDEPIPEDDLLEDDPEDDLTDELNDLDDDTEAEFADMATAETDVDDPADLALEEEPSDDGDDTAIAAEPDTDTTAPIDEPAADAVNGEIGDPPYLVRHPSRNDAEIATLEWMDFLVETGGVSGAAQTVAYYESVGWISPGIETYLQSMLNGFGDESAESDTDRDRDADADPEPRSVLSKAEHKRSLQYIARIATPEREPSILAAEAERDASDSRTRR